MKTYRIVLMILVVLLAGFAFMPVLAFPLDVDTTWQRFAEAYNPTEIYVNYPDGAPGSYFTVWGNNFQPNSSAGVYVNQIYLGTVLTSSNGHLELMLQTLPTNPLGTYQVLVTCAGASRTTEYQLIAGGIARPPESQDVPVIPVDDAAGWQNRVYFPVVKK